MREEKAGGAHEVGPVHRTSMNEKFLFHAIYTYTHVQNKNKNYLHIRTIIITFVTAAVIMR